MRQTNPSADQALCAHSQSPKPRPGPTRRARPTAPLRVDRDSGIAVGQLGRGPTPGTGGTYSAPTSTTTPTARWTLTIGSISSSRHVRTATPADEPSDQANRGRREPKGSLNPTPTTSTPLHRLVPEGAGLRPGREPRAPFAAAATDGTEATDETLSLLPQRDSERPSMRMLPRLRCPKSTEHRAAGRVRGSTVMKQERERSPSKSLPDHRPTYSFVR